MTTQPMRETAKICTVADLLNGQYIIQEGWKPNYVDVNNRKLSRVNIIGIVVDKSTPHDFMIDDGTGTISVSDFNQQKQVELLKVGEPVLLIGRPRQVGEQLFIACEIANSKQLKEDSGWVAYRKKELVSISSVSEEKTPSEEDYILLEESSEENSTETTDEVVEPLTKDVTGDDIVSFIRKKDTGEGCLVDDIVDYFGDDVDDSILTLITMGEIYEIKPGRMKVLE